MDMSEYIRYDGLGIAKLIKSKAIKPQEALQCALRLCDKLNPQLNAIIADHREMAQTQLDFLPKNAPFYGVPTLIKDLYFTIAGTTVTNGSNHFKSNLSATNCAYTQHLLNNGCAIFGKTNTAELGLSYSCEPQLHGPCHNPWDLSLSSGGSSGGCAAAVAARIVPFAAGNDSGGSLRAPAACCGLFGLKPTRNTTPQSFNEAETWSGLLCNHIITRSVRDSEAMLAHSTKHARTSNSDSHYRIAVLSGPFPDSPLHPLCQQAQDHAIKLLESLGHNVEPVYLNLNQALLDRNVFTLIAGNIFRLISLHTDQAFEHIEPITRAFANYGRQIQTEQMQLAKSEISQLTLPLSHLFAEYDLVLTPALAQPQLKLGYMRGDDDLSNFMQKCVEFSPYTSLFNQSGHPAMTLPVLHGDNHPPISVQFAANYYCESTLFDLAYAFEAINPWANTLPSLVANTLGIQTKVKPSYS